MALYLKGVLRIQLVPDIPEQSYGGVIDFELTEKLQAQIEQLLNIENKKPEHIMKPVDLLEYYKKLLLKLKEDNPEAFWDFIKKAEETERKNAARAESLSEDDRTPALESNIDS